MAERYGGHLEYHRPYIHKLRPTSVAKEYFFCISSVLTRLVGLFSKKPFINSFYCPAKKIKTKKKTSRKYLRVLATGNGRLLLVIK